MGFLKVVYHVFPWGQFYFFLSSLSVPYFIALFYCLELAVHYSVRMARGNILAFLLYLMENTQVFRNNSNVSSKVLFCFVDPPQVEEVASI